MKRKAGNDEAEPASRRKKKQNRADDEIAPTQPASSNFKVKGNRLTLKNQKPSQHHSGERARSFQNQPATLGGYEVVRSHRQPFQVQQDDRQDDRRKHGRPTQGNESYSNGTAWSIDLKGCEDNVRYGRNNKWDIPKYYTTAGGGSILGLDPAITVDRAQSTDVYYVLKYPVKVARARFEALVDDEGELGGAQHSDGEHVAQDGHESEDEVEKSFQEANYELRDDPSLPIVTPKG